MNQSQGKCSLPQAPTWNAIWSHCVNRRALTIFKLGKDTNNKNWYRHYEITAPSDRGVTLQDYSNFKLNLLIFLIFFLLFFWVNNDTSVKVDIFAQIVFYPMKWQNDGCSKFVTLIPGVCHRDEINKCIMYLFIL